MASTDINPTQMAQQLAAAYTQDAQTLLTNQTKAAQDASTGLTKLQSALQAFDSALTGLSTSKSVLQRTATLDQTDYGSATASSTAQPGNYGFFVEQLATTHQMAYQNVPTISTQGAAGTLGLQTAGGTAFSVALDGADLDGDGFASPTEIARAINQASGNAGQITASVITANGQTQLVMTSGHSGADGAITLDVGAVGEAKLRDALTAGNTLVAPQDAVVWLGAKDSGIRMQQSSNTFTAVDGVSMTFTKAMAPGTAPVNLTVAADDSGTAGNVQKLVDAYNTLEKSLDDLTAYASTDGKSPAGAFASDASVRALRSRIANLVRQPTADGLRLTDFGVTADREGNLQLDKTKLSAALVAHPTGLDAVLGRASLTASSGVLGGLDKAIGLWTNSAGGQIQQRQTTVQLQQKSFTDRQTRMDEQYKNLYQRYLAQFTQLQSLQTSMNNSSNLFTNLTA